mgnify:CR=1 FL=1
MNENTICKQCGGYTSYTSDETFVKLPARVVLLSLCPGHPEPAKGSHDGDLGHNATVYYDDDPYSTADGETFYVRSVMISAKMRHIALLPKEALSLLAWLQSERVTLEKLVNEEGKGEG